MPDGYGSHLEYMSWVAEDADKREGKIEKALRKAFAPFVEQRSVEVIVFSEMSIHQLAHSLIDFPEVLKPLLAICNIAGRAVERDLNIKNLNTYRLKLTEHQVNAIAGYLKPFLPPYLELPTLFENRPGAVH